MGLQNERMQEKTGGKSACRAVGTRTRKTGVSSVASATVADLSVL
jgi:hypothetical protein